jgi:predicted SnoaL-like aldol condensation-catalyzing enzyme
MKTLGLVLAPLALSACAAAFAQEPVVPPADQDALFHSSDPKLDANKQVAMHIVRDLLQCGHWELADKYLTERYIQHNPNAASGRAGVLVYFNGLIKAGKIKVKPLAAHVDDNVVSVVAEGDLVTVAYARPYHLDPADETSPTYTTTWFDQWRIKDGKADEHWDPATKPAPVKSTKPTAAASAPGK